LQFAQIRLGERRARWTSAGTVLIPKGFGFVAGMDVYVAIGALCSAVVLLEYQAGERKQRRVLVH